MINSPSCEEFKVFENRDTLKSRIDVLKTLARLVSNFSFRALQHRALQHHALQHHALNMHILCSHVT